jgi:hypothetical protein
MYTLIIMSNRLNLHIFNTSWQQQLLNINTTNLYLQRKADKKRVPLKRRVKQSAKLEHDLVCMVRPDPIADRDRERRLSRIATLSVSSFNYHYNFF